MSVVPKSALAVDPSPVSSSSSSPSPSPSPLPPSPRRPVELDESRLREIDAAASALLTECWKEEAAPLNLAVFTDGAGVPVRERGGRAEPMYAHHGRLLRLDGAPVIEVNRALDPWTRRLVVAHALGHHVLGHPAVPPEIPEHFGPTCQSVIEREATRFALALLLPEAALRRGMEEGWVSVKRLSEGFAMPEACVRERILQIERHCPL